MLYRVVELRSKLEVRGKELYLQIHSEIRVNQMTITILLAHCSNNWVYPVRHVNSLPTRMEYTTSMARKDNYLHFLVPESGWMVVLSGLFQQDLMDTLRVRPVTYLCTPMMFRQVWNAPPYDI